jgi:hypothetical protein
VDGLLQYLHNVKHWAKANVFFINDLLKNEGGFLSLEQFQSNYGIISNYLEYNGVNFILKSLKFCTNKSCERY